MCSLGEAQRNPGWQISYKKRVISLLCTAFNQRRLLNKILCELMDIKIPKLAKKVTIAVPP